MIISRGVDWICRMLHAISRARMRELAGVFRTYRTGKLTIIGLSQQYGDVPLQIGPAARRELARLIRLGRCKILGFDMAGIPSVPSSLLGLLASVASLVDELQLYNASDAVCEALEVYGLDSILKPVPAATSAPIPSLSV